MAPEVVILSGEADRLMRLAVAFNGTPYDVTAVEPVRTLRTAERLAIRGPAAMVVQLEGTENVAEIAALLKNARDTRFVFLVPNMPPSAALAKVVRAHGSSILARDEPEIVIVATLISSLAQSAADLRGGVA